MPFGKGRAPIAEDGVRAERSCICPSQRPHAVELPERATRMICETANKRRELNLAVTWVGHPFCFPRVPPPSGCRSLLAGGACVPAADSHGPWPIDGQTTPRSRPSALVHTHARAGRAKGSLMRVGSSAVPGKGRRDRGQHEDASEEPGGQERASAVEASEHEVLSFPSSARGPAKRRSRRRARSDATVVVWRVKYFYTIQPASDRRCRRRCTGCAHPGAPSCPRAHAGAAWRASDEGVRLGGGARAFAALAGRAVPLRHPAGNERRRARRRR